MVSESLARKFRPAGFEQPEGSRQNYVKPRPELQEAFYRWIEELPNQIDGMKTEEYYREAKESLTSFEEIPYKEANGLIAGFKPKRQKEHSSGLFISACYAHAPEKLIVFDVDAEDIHKIGCFLGGDKILVNNGVSGSDFGYRSSGVIINNGICEDWFGFFSSRIAVNRGKAGDKLGSCSLGIVITFEESGNEARFTANLIKLKDIDKFSGLKEYLEELTEITKSVKDEQSAKRFLERYGEKPSENIEAEIKGILRENGFEV